MTIDDLKNIGIYAVKLSDNDFIFQVTVRDTGLMCSARKINDNWNNATERFTLWEDLEEGDGTPIISKLTLINKIIRGEI